MNLRDRVRSDVKDAMRARDQARTGTLRLFLATLQEEEGAKRVRSLDSVVKARGMELRDIPAADLPADSPLLKMARAVDAHLGNTAKIQRASTDANIPLSIGIPAISIGAGGQGGGAHTPSEWFHPDGREVGLRRILLTLLLLLMEPI